MVYELDAEEAKALDAFRTLNAEQRRSLAESEKGTQAAGRQGKVVRILMGEWKSLVAAGMGMIGVNQAIRGGIELLREYEDHLKAISERQTKTAAGGVSLAMLQKSGTDVSRVLKEAAVLSAEQGISPEKGFEFFEQGQAIYGTFEKGAEAAVEALKLARVTGEPETAVGTIKIAEQLKMTQEAFNSLLVGAAVPSGANERVFAEVAPFWPLFTGKTGEPEPFFGAAATTALSQRIPNEMLATYVQAVNRTLTDVGVETIKELKKKGGALTVQEQITKELLGSTGKTFRDLSQVERLEAIGDITKRRYGGVNAETLRLMGIEEQRERTALATILTPENMALLKQVLAEAPTYAQKYDLDERLRTLQQDPTLRKKFLKDQAVATAEAYAYMGPESDIARAKEAQKLAAAAEVGYGTGADLETGEAGFWRRVQTGTTGTIGTGGTERMWAFGPYYDVRPPSGMEQLDRLEGALQESIQVLREIASNTTPAKREQVSLRTEGGF